MKKVDFKEVVKFIPKKHIRNSRFFINIVLPLIAVSGAAYLYFLQQVEGTNLILALITLFFATRYFRKKIMLAIEDHLMTNALIAYLTSKNQLHVLVKEAIKQAEEKNKGEK